MAKSKKIPLTEFAKEMVRLLEMDFSKGEVGELFRFGISRSYPKAQRHLEGRNKKIADEIEKYKDEFSGFISESLKNNPNYKNLNINNVAQDHIVSVCEILSHWQKNKDKLNDEKWIEKTLDDALHICIIEKNEDNKLNELKLRDKMPNGWEWNDNADFYARYKKAGIVISGKKK